MNAGGAGVGPVAPSTTSPGRSDTPLQPGILALAIGAPVLFAVACFMLMCVVWRRLDLRHWRGLPPDPPKQAAAAAVPRCIKIPVVIMQPDTRVDVGYILRAQQAQQAASGVSPGCRELDAHEQHFSVVTVMDPCGPLWRAASMTPSDFDAPGTPHIGTICGPAGPPCDSAAPSSTPGPAQLAAGELPVGFSLAPLPPEGFISSPTPSPSGMPPLGPPAAKGHSRRGSWGAAPAPEKRELPRRRWSAQPGQPSQQSQQAPQAQQEQGAGGAGVPGLSPAASRAAASAATSDQAQAQAQQELQHDVQAPGPQHARSRSAGAVLFWQRS
ncbi:hypothetical protein ABPG75_002958 [Micractinium tetrahymenae]